jgi:hypothetical protein
MNGGRRICRLIDKRPALRPQFLDPIRSRSAMVPLCEWSIDWRDRRAAVSNENIESLSAHLDLEHDWVTR